jgi:hypothetical protein
MGGLTFPGGLISAAIAVTLAFGAPSGPASTSLTAAQRDSIDGGELVTLSERRPTSSWPAVTIYVFIDASPEAATAVFTNYEQHVEYIPKMLESKVSRVVDRATKEVDYRVIVPVFPDEQYTVRNHLTRQDSTGYRVAWEMIRATSTKATVGHALFTPWVNAKTRKAGTLLEYYNFVTPGSSLAGLPFVRSRSLKQISETVRAIARQAEKESGRESSMRPLIQSLRSAVATP